jgi:hypothetical protein
MVFQVPVSQLLASQLWIYHDISVNICELDCVFNGFLMIDGLDTYILQLLEWTSNFCEPHQMSPPNNLFENVCLKPQYHSDP